MGVSYFYVVLQFTHMGEADSFYDNSIFWVEVERISPNPYQPRKEFDEAKLKELADSIRQYGVLQPLVVTRHEQIDEENGLSVHYELIAGERRLRASKISGLRQVPVIIRSGQDDGKVKLELAIIENLQREDLNPIDKARAFARLVQEFGYRHGEVASKVGKSREYISNMIRLLNLPEEIQQAVVDGKISEGHSKTLLMLADRPEEQNTLFKEVLYKKLTVRETENVARRIAVDRVRKKELNPEMLALERELTETLGTRVHIKPEEQGGKIMIEYFSPDDLQSILNVLHKTDSGEKPQNLLNKFLASMSGEEASQKGVEQEGGEAAPHVEEPNEEEKKEEELYSVKNFTI